MVNNKLDLYVLLAYAKRITSADSSNEEDQGGSRVEKGQSGGSLPELKELLSRRKYLYSCQEALKLFSIPPAGELVQNSFKKEVGFKRKHKIIYTGLLEVKIFLTCSK